MNLTPRRQSLRFVAFVRRTGRLSHLSCPRCCCHRPFFFFRFFFCNDRWRVCHISLCVFCCRPCWALLRSSAGPWCLVHNCPPGTGSSSFRDCLMMDQTRRETDVWKILFFLSRVDSNYFGCTGTGLSLTDGTRKLTTFLPLSLLFFNWFILSSLALRRLPNGKGVSSSKLYWQWSSVHDPLPARLPWWWWWMTPCRFHQATAPRFVSKRHFWK